MSTEAKQQVELILKNCEVTFAATPAGEKNRDGWKCDAWLVSFTKGDGRAAHEEFDYFTGTGLRKAPEWKSGTWGYDGGPAPRPGTVLHEQWMKGAKPVPPHAADVLHSLILDSSAAEQTFADWCADFGYDTDSRKALATYEASQQNTDKLRRVFDGTAIDALSEALQDY